MSTTLKKLAVVAVTASGYESPNVPNNTIDGNLSTRWSCQGTGSWIQYDFGSVQNVAEIDIAWYDGNQRVDTFRIEALSASGSPYDIYSGKSSGTTTSLEKHTLSSPISTRYVRITFVSNTQNNWASVTEVQIQGAVATPPPPPPPPPTGLDIDGVQMLEPSNPNGPVYFYRMSDNIENSSHINTDRNTATQMVDGNIPFKRLTSTDVSYSTGTGKTCRVNLNAGGFYTGVQQHTWKDSPQYIWTAADSKNVEFTYYFRVVNLKQSHTTCSTKMRGGIHTGSNDPRASCFETTFFIVGGESSKVESAYEYNHPNYVFSSITPLIPNASQGGKWIGRKTVCWTGSDGKVHTIDYIDWNPFDSSGKPVNNWHKFFTQDFGGTSSDGYSKPPTWGGMFTFRQDGFEFVDIAIISIREILPPT